MVFHRLTRRKEDHEFLLSVLLKEGKEQKESLFRGTNNISLQVVQIKIQINQANFQHHEPILIVSTEKKHINCTAFLIAF